MPIVCLFGPDGSGKTSLAKKVAMALAKKGCRVKISWMRGTHAFSFALAKLLCLYETSKGCGSHKILVPTKLRPMWSLVEFCSMIPILLVRFILPNILGIWVIADRYTIDFVVWISIITEDENYIHRFESKFLLSLAKKADVKIYVTADIKELERRSFESARFLADQLRLYQSLAKALSSHTLNTTNMDVEKSFEEVESLICLRYLRTC